MLPLTAAEAKRWVPPKEPIRRDLELAPGVLCVATTTRDGWFAKCAAEDDPDEVLESGSIMPHKLAAALFEEYEFVPYDN